jgi:metal-responsive CopG/Arc/MetJ family transcriptional regulator
MFEEAKKSNRRTSRMSVSILKTIHDKFNEHVEAVGYDKSRLVEKILEEYLNKLNK